MKLFLFTTLFLVLLGCQDVNRYIKESRLQSTQKPQAFHTNMERFTQEIAAIRSKEARNRFIQEYLQASDMECNAYEYKMINEEAHTKESESLYTTLFKALGDYFGWESAKEAIDTLSNLSGANQQSLEQKYTQALSPNILKAIAIARQKYASKITKKMAQPLKEYSMQQVLKDLDAYDQRCSTYYGLVEITNALKRAEDATFKEAIDVEDVSSKVKKVTNEVIQKEQNATKSSMP